MDNLGGAMWGFFLATGALWQLLATVLLLIAGYVVLSLALGCGVRAVKNRARRRREAQHSTHELSPRE